MSEHTPTPWTSKLFDGSYRCIVYGPGKIEVVSTSWHGTIRARYPLKAEALANIDFVVKAVNNHEALVEALIGARAFMQNVMDERGDSGVSILIKCADAALEKVKSCPRK